MFCHNTKIRLQWPLVPTFVLIQNKLIGLERMTIPTKKVEKKLRSSIAGYQSIHPIKALIIATHGTRCTFRLKKIYISTKWTTFFFQFVVVAVDVDVDVVADDVAVVDVNINASADVVVAVVTVVVFNFMFLELFLTLLLSMLWLWSYLAWKHNLGWISPTFYAPVFCQYSFAKK